MWRHIGQSLQGSSHLADGTPCQDSHAVRLLGKDGSPALVACVADGAGSAKHSELGSSIVCNTVIENAARHFENHGTLDNVKLAHAIEWCGNARKRIFDAASLHDGRARDFATTLCVAIMGSTQSHFFQIGDGAIVLGNDSLYGVVFWPQSGEYANTTNFLTSDDFEKQLEFFTTPTTCSKVALMTDGIERIALRFDTQTPHVPFFDPLFRALRTASDVSIMNEGLRGFLASDSVQLRSDDDKTLILATTAEDDTA